MTDNKPKPGSPEAVALGCRCPVYDNCNGEGVVIDGERVWWRTVVCPLHGLWSEEEVDDERA